MSDIKGFVSCTEPLTVFAAVLQPENLAIKGVEAIALLEKTSIVLSVSLKTICGLHGLLQVF